MTGAAAAALALGGYWWFGKESAQNPARDASAQADKPAPMEPHGSIRINAEQIARLGIRLARAEAATEVPLATIPAVIAPPPNARVAVAATFPGIVIRTLVVEGDTVRRGQPLAVISSRDVLVMASDLSRASARLGVAQSSAQRLTQLDREGIIAGARAEEARALLREARADTSEKSRILHMVNASGANGNYVLTAPIAGRVTSAAIHTGSPVDGNVAPYVIDAADRYEAEGQLPERLAAIVRPGMRVELLSGTGRPSISGKLNAVGSTIDPATRSVSVKASLPAGPGMISGRATSIAIYGPSPANAVTVPSSAITSLSGADTVFVRTSQGFAARKISAGGAFGGRTVLLSGLGHGEEVVTAGVSELKSLALSR